MSVREADEDDRVEDTPRSRLTVALAVLAIAATLALLAAGFVLAPDGEPDGVEASLVTSAAAPHDHAAATTAPTSAPSEHEATHEHDDVATAASAPNPDTTVAHPHAEPAAAASTPATHDHEVAVTVPAAPDVPVTTAPEHVHDTAPAAPTAPAGPIVTVDDSRLTAAQQEAARSLLDATRAAMAAFPDEAAVLAAGYQSIGDAITGFEHFVHAGYLDDGIDLDPTRIESIVLRVAGGTKTVESAMYVLGPAATMADVPDIAGELTTWHDHQNLCWDGLRVVGVTRSDGSCPRGEFRPTPPMLHVWLADQACGPFSGIEGIHGGGCGADHH